MEKTLILEFVTADEKKKTVTIANPKDDLTKAVVYAAMQAIVDNNFYQVELEDFSDAYYKAVEVTALD